MLMWWLKVSYAMDAARVWPRLFVGTYLWELTRVIEWYIVHPTKTWDIAAFITAYAVLCVPLLKWYMESGVDWTQYANRWFNLKEPRDVDRSALSDAPVDNSISK